MCQTVLTAAFRRIIETIDPDGIRPGTKETPDRMARAWLFHTSGYSAEPEEILKDFEQEHTVFRGLVIQSGIRFYSRCEHHGEAIIGMATIGYIPRDRVVGLSKLKRITDAFALRLQVQERMTQQIADTLNEHLSPRAVTVLTRARHLCMESRGVRSPGTVTEARASRGSGIDMAEFLAAVDRGPI